MKRALIVHGWTANPQMHWFPDLIQFLKEQGYQTEAPVMPERFTPVENVWVKVIEDFGPDKKTILLGHSLGGTTILEYLENTDKKVDKVILFGTPIRNHESLELGEIHSYKLYAQSVAIECLLDLTGYEEIYDWENIRQKANNFSLIYKRDDKLVPLDDGKVLAKRLDAKIHILEGHDHCDYVDFRLLQNLVMGDA